MLEGEVYRCVDTEETGVCSLSGSNECLDENVTGISLDTIFLRPGFWRVSNHSLIVKRCAKSDFCVGGQDFTSSCLENHVGPYCEVCVDNHMMTVDGCVKCGGGESATIFVLILVLLGVLVFLYFVLVKLNLSAEKDTAKRTVKLLKKMKAFGTLLRNKLSEWRVQLKVVLVSA